MRRMASMIAASFLVGGAWPAWSAPSYEIMCRPAADMTAPLDSAAGTIDAQSYTGPVCLQLCKASLTLCKSASSSLKKCQTKSAKISSKRSVAYCRLNGQPKSHCSQQARMFLHQEKQTIKGIYGQHKEDCAAAYEVCKEACAAP